MASGNIESVNLGPCYVIYNGNYVGFTSGGVSVQINTTTQKVSVDSFGRTIIKEYVTERTAKVTLPLAEQDTTTISAIFSNTGYNSATGMLNSEIGEELSSVSAALVLTTTPPVDMPGGYFAAVRPEPFTVIIPSASPLDETTVNFSVQDLNTITVVMSAYPDSNGNIISFRDTDYYYVTSGSYIDNMSVPFLNYNKDTDTLTFKASKIYLKGNLPTSNPNVIGQVYNNGNILSLGYGTESVPSFENSGSKTVSSFFTYDPGSSSVVFTPKNIVFPNLPSIPDDFDHELISKTGTLCLSSSEMSYVLLPTISPDYSILFCAYDSANDILILNASNIYLPNIPVSNPGVANQIYSNGNVVSLGYTE